MSHVFPITEHILLNAAKPAKGIELCYVTFRNINASFALELTSTIGQQLPYESDELKSGSDKRIQVRLRPHC
jgi:hypothetical protein